MIQTLIKMMNEDINARLKTDSDMQPIVTTSASLAQNPVLAAVRDMLEEKSNEAVSRGNEFKGFLGFSPAQYSKEDLILILNVLFDEIESLRITQSRICKETDSIEANAGYVVKLG